MTTDELLDQLASELSEAVNGTVDALLWATRAGARILDDGTIVEDSDSDASFESLNFDRGDVAEESMTSIKREVADFIAGNTDDVIAYVATREFNPSEGSVWSYLGHDLALTREGHGTGFWDRGLGEIGERLTDACKPYGEFGLYLGDDGKVHVQ